MMVNENQEGIRETQLMGCIPDLYRETKTLLYVGGHLRYGRNLQMTKGFREAGSIIDVVEIHKGNVQQLSTLEYLRYVWCQDIRNFHIHNTMRWDVIMFWHGVEHLQKEEIPDLLESLEKMAIKYIIFATPYGEYEQGEEYGNPHEVHQSHWMPEDFTKIGMEVNAIGKPHKKQGNIIAWKKI